MTDANMSGNTDSTELQETLSSLGKLEEEFAAVELKYLRQKEHDLKPLFAKRSVALQEIPSFWQTVFLNGPEELQQLYSPNDLAVLSALTSFSVERYQIKSHNEGDPRSLRFTFKFGENEFFEDKKLVKDFEYVPRPESAGDLISKPVPIKWKGKKKDLTGGVLDAAVELYQAEQAMTLNKDGKAVDMVDREGLWQFEKLSEKLRNQEESDEQPSFMNFFGFRGAVDRKEQETKADDGEEAQDEEDDEEDDGMLEVEVFPPGDEVAMCLAEEVWSDAMDYFMQAHADSASDFDGFDESDPVPDNGHPGFTIDADFVDVDSDGVPDLVGEEELAELTNLRPAKRQRRD